MSELLQVGDVVKAPAGWVYAVGRSGPVKPLQVADNTDEQSVVRDTSGEPLAEYNHYDPTREGALFVVEEAVFAGGGASDAFPWEPCPNGWRVTASRLAQNGLYDEHGERVEFYQTGPFLFMSSPEVVGRMRRIFVPAE